MANSFFGITIQSIIDNATLFWKSWFKRGIVTVKDYHAIKLEMEIIIVYERTCLTTFPRTEKTES